jgi:DNA-binding transcriptional ArsR family regulator
MATHTPAPPLPAGPDLDAVFTALADPTRRAVVELLAGTPSSAGELAEHLPVTRQAVSKHLAVLERAGLVQSARIDRRVVYELTPAAFADAATWMARVGADWDRRLAALARHLAAKQAAG